MISFTPGRFRILSVSEEGRGLIAPTRKAFSSVAARQGWDITAHIKTVGYFEGLAVVVKIHVSETRHYVRRHTVIHTGGAVNKEIRDFALFCEEAILEKPKSGRATPYSPEGPPPKCRYMGFMVFAFDRSRPVGGIGDLLGIMPTQREAFALAEACGHTDWQIVRARFHKYVLIAEGITLNGKSIVRYTGKELGKEGFTK